MERNSVDGGVDRSSVGGGVGDEGNSEVCRVSDLDKTM